MSVVLDASVTIAWIDPAETTDAVRLVFEQIAASSGWVPGLWRIEVANVLEIRVRRGRNDADFRENTLADLALLPIKVDLETHERAWQATLRLAVRHKLTLYDATYLELALRRGLPLATLDRELKAAAALEQVRVLGE